MIENYGIDRATKNKSLYNKIIDVIVARYSNCRLKDLITKRK